MVKCVILFLIALLSLSGCSENRELPEKESQAYQKLVEEIKKIKIGDKSEFLAGRALMSYHLFQTFDRLPKNSKGRYILVPDNVYWCPTKTWLENTLLPYCKKQFEDRAIAYSINYDCDDYSRDFTSFALEKFRKENVSLPINSLCVAEVMYVPAYSEFLRSLGLPADDHAINFVVVSDDNEVVFIEPQSCKIVQLTEEEIKSIYFVKF